MKYIKSEEPDIVADVYHWDGSEEGAHGLVEWFKQFDVTGKVGSGVQYRYNKEDDLPWEERHLPPHPDWSPEQVWVVNIETEGRHLHGLTPDLGYIIISDDRPKGRLGFWPCNEKEFEEFVSSGYVPVEG